MTREITHMKAFTIALQTLVDNPLKVGELAPNADLVNKYFNDSTDGEEGEDSRGPWNQGDNWEYVQAPAFQHLAAGLRRQGSNASFRNILLARF
jgi:Mn-containing catalase